MGADRGGLFRGGGPGREPADGAGAPALRPLGAAGLPGPGRIPPDARRGAARRPGPGGGQGDGVSGHGVPGDRARARLPGGDKRGPGAARCSAAPAPAGDDGRRHAVLRGPGKAGAALWPGDGRAPDGLPAPAAERQPVAGGQLLWRLLHPRRAERRGAGDDHVLLPAGAGRVREPAPAATRRGTSAWATARRSSTASWSSACPTSAIPGA